MRDLTENPACRAGPAGPRAGQGIYVHIPFCIAKCFYCDFNSYPTDRGVPDWYVAALTRDIACEAGLWPERFATVYFGGGTPSLLEPQQIETIIGCLKDHLSLEPGCEATLECNPATVTRAKMAAYRAAGVTRLSVGVQSLCEQELRVLGRMHNCDEALTALVMARQAGFLDVSADVMLGIPGQTTASFEATLAGVVDLVTHVSVYMLTIEPGTPFAESVSRGLLREPDDDLLAGLYEHAAGILAASGLARYEISNFAREGYMCRHNCMYWRCGNYVGLGAGAHSHRYGRRCAKVRNPKAYSDALASSSSAVEYDEALTSEQKMLEEVMLGLRTSRGIAARLPEEFPFPGRAVLAAKLHSLVKGGFLVRKRNLLKLSPKGVLVHDAVCAEIARALPADPVRDTSA